MDRRPPRPPLTTLDHLCLLPRLRARCGRCFHPKLWYGHKYLRKFNNKEDTVASVCVTKPLTRALQPMHWATWRLCCLSPPPSNLFCQVSITRQVISSRHTLAGGMKTLNVQHGNPVYLLTFYVTFLEPQPTWKDITESSGQFKMDSEI